MIKILFISENNTQISKFKNIFDKNMYDFTCITDGTLITDTIDADTPDIIFLDTEIANLKEINKKIKQICENVIVIFLVNEKFDKELVKFANAFVTLDMPDDLITSTVNVNLRMKNALEMLSSSNKDLADSLYRLNALYDTSSKFAGTLDKDKLMQYMIEGMDKALSFSLTSTL